MLLLSQPPPEGIDLETSGTIARTGYRESFDRPQKIFFAQVHQPRQNHLDMEAFHLLSRGGVKFDKQKYRDDVKLFNVSIVVRSSHHPGCSRY